MSTKTTFKRVALVTVAALGFGMLTGVATANAATVSSITVGTIPTARVGESVTIPITINLSGAGTANETSVVAAKVSSAPSTAGGQTATSVLGATSNNSVTNPIFYLGTSAAGTVPSSLANTATKSSLDLADNAGVVGGFLSGTTTAGDIAAGTTTGSVAASALTVVHTAASTVTAYLTVRPDVAGTYSVLVSVTNGDGVTRPSYSYEAGVGISTLVTFTTGGAPTTLTLTNISGTTNTSGAYGALVRVNLNGPLTGDEAVAVTTSSGNIAGATVSGGVFTSVQPTASTTARLTKANFINGVAFVNVDVAAAATATVTATGTGTLAAITANTTVTAATAAANIEATTFAGRAGTAVTTGWSLATAATSATSVTIKSTATSSTIELTHADPGLDADSVAVTKYGYITVEDQAGAISGATGTGHNLYFDKSFTATGTAAGTKLYSTIALTHTALGTGAFDSGYGYSFDDNHSTVGLMKVAGATPTSNGRTIAVSPGNARVAAGGSIVLTATVTDQFATAISESVTTSVAGRNGARTSEVQTGSSTGVVTSTITDAGTSTSSATDTVTFTAAGGATGSATLTWGAYTVGTVTVTGGKTASDTYEGQNLTSISTAVAGPHGASVAITATVKDSAGNVLAGVPVTFAVSSGLIQKTATVDYTTVYTGSLGTAVTRVIDWVEGKQTITATAGGVSGTDYLTWDQNTAASARSISGAAEGNKVTATVKDRFGNTVKGVIVTASTASGYFGTGSNSTTGTTASNGTVSFFINGASGATSVTLSLDKDTYTQSIDLVGEVDATAVTAAVAGTTTGTGASLAAAGVNSVVVSVDAVDAAATNAQAATDAAAEATDAANAATDAANAAAEAADAATAAAQDAADAVAALSAQVASLISGLKSQLTALTNLVIKIQKKVRA
jgi:hypothetical protein